MNGFGRLATVVGLGVLAAAGVTGVLAGPGGVLRGGPESPPAAAESADVLSPDHLIAEPDDAGDLEVKGDVIDCAAGEDTQFKFETEDDEFEVTGLLVSLDGGTVVVTGPDGEVAAAVAPDAEVKGDPSPGDAVKVEGSVLNDGSFQAGEVEPACEDAAEADIEDVDDPDDVDLEECNRGPGEGGDLRLEIEGNEVEIERGTVLSFDGGALTVDTPAGPFTVIIDAGTDADGDLSVAEEVRVEGTLINGSTVLAEEAKALCPDAAHHDDDDDEGGDQHGDDDHDGDDEDDDEDED